MNSHAELLALQLPPVAYDRNAPKLNAEISAEGGALDAAASAVQTMLLELFPETCNLTLPDWERVYGLPDDCVAGTQTVQERKASLAARVLGGGGLNDDYYIALAAALGYLVTINTFPTFRVETSRVEQQLFDDSWKFVYRVNAALVTERPFRVEVSHVEERLSTWGNTLLECVLGRLKPAHGKVLFGYT